MERKVNVVEDLDGNKIYDIMNKKRNEHPFPAVRLYSIKNPFLIFKILWKGECVKRFLKKFKRGKIR